jgi:hypothetical protein
MEVIWLVLSLLALNLAAFVFAVDSRPGFEHTAQFPNRRTTPG